MQRVMLVLLGSSLVACATAPAPPAGGAAECVGCQPILDPPERPATAYRFEVQYWEMPLARAESLYRTADRDSSSIALQIDHSDLGARLRALYGSDSGVLPLAPASCEARASARALVPAAFPGWDRPSRPWSEGLRLELGAAPTTGWSPHMLDFACVWTSPQGERLASARGTTPLAPNHGVVVWCLPSQSLADVSEPRTARAVVVLVRVVPYS